MTQLICGVDVSSTSLEASIGAAGATGSFANNPDGIDALAAFYRHAQDGELLPEIGTLPNKTVSKLAGLAPLANDSGKHQGKRFVRGGRAPLRDILFLVAGVAGRYEPDFVAFQQRLRDAGKPPKVVRIALAHKLLVRLNAKARDIRNANSNPLPA